jgi:hypothetical protein
MSNEAGHRSLPSPRYAAITIRLPTILRPTMPSLPLDISERLGRDQILALHQSTPSVKVRAVLIPNL